MDFLTINFCGIWLRNRAVREEFRGGRGGYKSQQRGRGGFRGWGMREGRRHQMGFCDAGVDGCPEEELQEMGVNSFHLIPKKFISV